MDDLAAEKLARLEQAILIDLQRSMTAHMPPKAILARLKQIPEFKDALEGWAQRSHSG